MIIGYFNSERSDMVSLLPKTYSKVLEVGCGTGRFAQKLIVNCETWGVEKNVAAGKVAKKHIDKVIIGDFFDVNDELPNDYFDLVICNDVIEHLIDHDLFFEIVRRKMVSDAYLIGSLPNLRHIKIIHRLLINKDWCYEEEGLMDRSHLRWFTEKSLKRTFHTHNFEIIKFVRTRDPKIDFKTPIGFFIRPLFLLSNMLSLGLLSTVDTRAFRFCIQKKD